MFDFESKGIRIAETTEEWVSTTCPKCSHTRKKHDQPCLTVFVKDGGWNCHHCGWKGRFGNQELIEYPEDIPNFSMEEEPSKGFLHPEGIRYLRERGISDGTAIANRVCSSSSIVGFPRYYPDGSVVGIQYRDTSVKKGEVGHFTQKKEGLLAFWGYHNVFSDGYPNTDTLYITEGVEDALSLWEAGFFFTLSLPSGAGSTKAADDFAFQELLKSVKKVVLCLDADDPGQRAADDLARRVGYHRALKVQLPKDCKDANDVLVKHGVAELRKVVNDAQPYPVEGLFTIKNARNELRAMRDGGIDRGRSTGIETIDKIFRWRQAMLVEFGAVPKAGKSRLLNQLLINDAKQHGTIIAMFAPESLPIAYHTSKMQAAYTGKPFEKLTEEEFELSYEFIAKHFTWMVPADFGIRSLLDLCRAALETKGASTFLFDPFNYIATSGEDEHHGIGEILAQQVDFTRKTNSIIINIAHPKKLELIKPPRSGEYTEMTGEYPIVTAYDMSGSAHHANRSDVFLSLWRSVKENHPIQLHVGLSKFEEVAVMGEKALLQYDVPTSRFRSYYGITSDIIPSEFEDEPTRIIID